MYIRTIKRKNKDGSVVEYVQLAHNVRHPEKRYPKAEVIHSFGRREQLDIDGLKRLVTSIGRFIEPDDGPADASIRPDMSSMTFVRSQSVGGVLLLEGLWDRLQITDCLQAVIDPQSFSASSRPALFALVASGALAPLCGGPFTFQVDAGGRFFNQYGSLEDRHFDHCMELLRSHGDAIQQTVFRGVVRHLDLDRDRVFVLLIPGCLISSAPESPLWMDDGWRRRAETIALAVSRAGIPMGCWLMPGRELDNDFIQSIERHLAQWATGRIIWVMDGRTSGDQTRDVLRRNGSTYIRGERYVKRPRQASPRIDGARIGQEEKQEGDDSLFSNDDCLPLEILAWGYQQLFDIDRAAARLTPGMGRPSWGAFPDEDTHARMLLFWLTLLMMRIAEMQTGMTWLNLSREMQGLHLGEFLDGNRRFFTYTALTPGQKKIIDQLGLELPPASHAPLTP